MVPFQSTLHKPDALADVLPPSADVAGRKRPSTSAPVWPQGEKIIYCVLYNSGLYRLKTLPFSPYLRASGAYLTERSPFQITEKMHVIYK
jgi:hypothetical protein